MLQTISHSAKDLSWIFHKSWNTRKLQSTNGTGITNVWSGCSELLYFLYRMVTTQIDQAAIRLTMVLTTKALNFQHQYNISQGWGAKPKTLAINVFGCDNNYLILHSISRKEANMPRINLILFELGKKEHYCDVKRVSHMLYDHSKARNAKNYCIMCLTGFLWADLLMDRENCCNGVNGRSIRIEMPEEGKTLYLSKIITNRWRRHTWYMRTSKPLVRKI